MPYLLAGFVFLGLVLGDDKKSQDRHGEEDDNAETDPEMQVTIEQNPAQPHGLAASERGPRRHLPRSP